MSGSLPGHCLLTPCFGHCVYNQSVASFSSPYSCSFVHCGCHYYRHVEFIRMSDFQKAWSWHIPIKVLICLFILLENPCNTRQKQDGLEGIVKNKLQESRDGRSAAFFQVGEHGFECNLKLALFRKGEKDETCTPSGCQRMKVYQSTLAMGGWAFILQWSGRHRLTIKVICRSILR